MVNLEPVQTKMIDMEPQVPLHLAVWAIIFHLTYTQTTITHTQMFETIVTTMAVPIIILNQIHNILLPLKHIYRVAIVQNGWTVLVEQAALRKPK